MNIDKSFEHVAALKQSVRALCSLTALFSDMSLRFADCESYETWVAARKIRVLSPLMHYYANKRCLVSRVRDVFLGASGVVNGLHFCRKVPLSATFKATRVTRPFRSVESAKRRVVSLVRRAAFRAGLFAVVKKLIGAIYFHRSRIYFSELGLGPNRGNATAVGFIIFIKDLKDNRSIRLTRMSTNLGNFTYFREDKKISTFVGS